MICDFAKGHGRPVHLQEGLTEGPCVRLRVFRLLVRSEASCSEVLVALEFDSMPLQLHTLRCARFFVSVLYFSFVAACKRKAACFHVAIRIVNFRRCAVGGSATQRRREPSGHTLHPHWAREARPRAIWLRGPRVGLGWAAI